MSAGRAPLIVLVTNQFLVIKNTERSIRAEQVSKEAHPGMAEKLVVAAAKTTAALALAKAQAVAAKVTILCGQKEARGMEAKLVVVRMLVATQGTMVVVVVKMM